MTRSSGSPKTSRATLDSGALIAFERRARAVVRLVKHIEDRGGALAIPAGVVAQVWRDPARQVLIRRLLHSPVVEIVDLTGREARLVGQLLAITGARDVVDASVVLCARQRDHVVFSSDRDDLLAIDPRLPVIAC